MAAHPLLAAKGKQAIPGLLLRWWGQVCVVLERANADAALASMGMMGAARTLGVDGVPEVHELLLAPGGAVV